MTVEPIGLATMLLLYFDNTFSSNCNDLIDVLDKSNDIIRRVELVNNMRTEAGLFDDKESMDTYNDAMIEYHDTLIKTLEANFERVSSIIDSLNKLIRVRKLICSACVTGEKWDDSGRKLSIDFTSKSSNGEVITESFIMFDNPESEERKQLSIEFADQTDKSEKMIARITETHDAYRWMTENLYDDDDPEDDDDQRDGEFSVIGVSL
jgi:hypothetical protein